MSKQVKPKNGTQYTIIKQSIEKSKGQFIVQKNGGEEEFFGYGGFLGQKHTMDSVMKTIYNRELGKVSQKAVRAEFTIADVFCELDVGKQGEMFKKQVGAKRGK